MPDNDAIKYGILRTRDLVELYYRGRMATQIAENTISTISAASQVLIGQNVARIRYEIVLANLGAPALTVQIGTLRAFGLSQAAQYRIPGNNTQVIVRDFTTDLDLVCHGLLFISTVAGIQLSTRETILTPLPVDEEP